MVPAASLPPGSRAPRSLQTLAMLTRQRPWLERLHARHGDLFRIDVAGIHRLVILAEPTLIRQVFTADPTVLHAGTGSPVGSVLGPHSLLAIDEDRHLEQRKLLLPPFHGRRMQAYEGLIADIAAEEVDRWPTGRPFATAPSFMAITLRAILRAVFGARGAALAELERLIPPWVEQGSRLAGARYLHRDLGPLSPWVRFRARRAAIDARLDALIAEARADDGLADRVDVLALLVQATHSDGAPMADAEIRDELMTLLAAGHETTATTLAWAVERLRRHPAAAARLTEEARDGGRTLRDSAIRELQRVRPVVSFAGRLVRTERYELGGYQLPRGTRIALAAVLTHNDPRLFADPGRFVVDRFVEAKPDTYTWIPFGGGIRRCIGAAFAHMELDVVLRTVLERVDLEPSSAPSERWAFRGVTHAPADGGLAVVRRRATPAGRATDPGRVLSTA